jgi:hypothetical protein
MRPGEIFGLTVKAVTHGYADIRQRVYRGVIDTPKTDNSIREVGLPPGLKEDFFAQRYSIQEGAITAARILYIVFAIFKRDCAMPPRNDCILNGQIGRLIAPDRKWLLG